MERDLWARAVYGKQLLSAGKNIFSAKLPSETLSSIEAIRQGLLTNPIISIAICENNLVHAPNQDLRPDLTRGKCLDAAYSMWHAACSELLRLIEYRVAYRHAHIVTYTVTLTMKHRMTKEARYDLTILNNIPSSNRMRYMKTFNIFQNFSLHSSLLASQFEIEFRVLCDISFDIIFDTISSILLTLYLIHHLINAHSIESEESSPSFEETLECFNFYFIVVKHSAKQLSIVVVNYSAKQLKLIDDHFKLLIKIYI